MDNFELLERLGAGAFSVVWKARERGSARLFAVKELLDEGLPWAAVQALPEVTAARALPAHEGLLRLHAVHRHGRRVFMVMDYCRGSLLDAVARAGGLPEAQVRFVMRRLLGALAALHGSGHVHRDIKPENVLLGAGGAPLLADFGQLRALGGGGAPLTPYVSTRWYRAPEVLLRCGVYGAAVDVWAMGATMCELLSGRPAFPGASEADQLFRLCAVLGAPGAAQWPQGAAAAAAVGLRFSDLPPRGLASLLPPGTSPAALRAVAAMLAWDPAARPSAQGALEALDFFSQPLAPEAPLPPPAGAARPGAAARARAAAAARQARLEEEGAGKEAEGGGGGGGGGSGAAAAARMGKEADSDDEGGGGAPAGGRGAGAAAAAVAVASRPAPRAPAGAAARSARSLFASSGGKDDDDDGGGGGGGGVGVGAADSGINYGAIGGKEGSDSDSGIDSDGSGGGGYKPSSADIGDSD